MAENEKPDMENYVYCVKHDIFFNPRLKEEADRENEELKTAGLLERADACPMCKQEFALAVMRIHMPTGPDQDSRLMREHKTEDLSEIR